MQLPCAAGGRRSDVAVGLRRWPIGLVGTGRIWCRPTGGAGAADGSVGVGGVVQPVMATAAAKMTAVMILTGRIATPSCSRLVWLLASAWPRPITAQPRRASQRRRNGLDPVPIPDRNDHSTAPGQRPPHPRSARPASLPWPHGQARSGMRPTSPAGWCRLRRPPDPTADEPGRPIALDLAASRPTCTTGPRAIQVASIAGGLHPRHPPLPGSGGRLGGGPGSCSW